MTVSVASMRAYGDSLEKMTVPVSVCSVRTNLPFSGPLLMRSLVTHGLMSRVFLMKWYHFSVEYFEDLRNVNHCEFLIMRKKEDSGKFILENNLRTWSELKREREAEKKEREKEPQLQLQSQAQVQSQKDKEKPATAEKDKIEKLLDGAANPLVPKRKQWGGCPNGCDHRRHYFKQENSMHAMQLNGKVSNPGESPVVRRPPPRQWQSSSEEDEDDPRGRIGPPYIDVQRSLDEMVSSPDGTPSFISMEDRLRSRIKSPNHVTLLRAGRDFGGSASGNTSQAGSDTEDSAAEAAYRAKGKSVVVGRTKGSYNGTESGMGRGAKADALGDQSDVGSDAGSEGEEELERAEKEDKSIKGSVY